MGGGGGVGGVGGGGVNIMSLLLAWLHQKSMNSEVHLITRSDIRMLK